MARSPHDLAMVMRYLQRNGNPRTKLEIAEALGYSASIVSGLLTKLLEMGWVQERNKEGERRRVFVYSLSELMMAVELSFVYVEEQLRPLLQPATAVPVLAQLIHIEILGYLRADKDSPRSGFDILRALASPQRTPETIEAAVRVLIDGGWVLDLTRDEFGQATFRLAERGLAGELVEGSTAGYVQGLGENALVILAQLRENGEAGCTANELLLFIHITATSLYTMLKNLINYGLVDRVAGSEPPRFRLYQPPAAEEITESC